ncbi:hypothetical protein BKA70DRAFT_1225438 [Coprinopsis sp. MPI-PUGE-AT-0042]|nr:hypothetical protein BKA70DRAFT_1225438 [Coprinopsis sp. MPI-PUGE-AT-0042]
MIWGFLASMERHGKLLHHELPWMLVDDVMKIVFWHGVKSKDKGGEGGSIPDVFGADAAMRYKGLPEYQQLLFRQTRLMQTLFTLLITGFSVPFVRKEGDEFFKITQFPISSSDDVKAVLLALTERFITKRFACGEEYGRSPSDRDYTRSEKEKDLRNVFNIRMPEEDDKLMKSTTYRSLCLQDNSSEESKRFVTYDPGSLSPSGLGKKIRLKGYKGVIREEKSIASLDSLSLKVKAIERKVRAYDKAGSKSVKAREKKKALLLGLFHLSSSKLSGNPRDPEAFTH